MFQKPPQFPGFEPGLTGGWSGTSNLSHEELARNEVFYHAKRSGVLTYMGKQPDIRTSEGAVLAFNKISGDVRVVNNYMPGLSDAQAVDRFIPSLKRALSDGDRARLLSRSMMRMGETKGAAGKVAGATARIMKML